MRPHRMIFALLRLCRPSSPHLQCAPRLAVASPALRCTGARSTLATVSTPRAPAPLARPKAVRLPRVSALAVWSAESRYLALREALEQRLRSALRRIPPRPFIPPSPHCKKYKRHRSRLRHFGVRTWRLVPFTRAWPRQRFKFVRLSPAAQTYLHQLRTGCFTDSWDGVIPDDFDDFDDEFEDEDEDEDAQA